MSTPNSQYLVANNAEFLGSTRLFNSAGYDMSFGNLIGDGDASTNPSFSGLHNATSYRILYKHNANSFNGTNYPSAEWGIFEDYAILQPNIARSNLAKQDGIWIELGPHPIGGGYELIRINEVRAYNGFNNPAMPEDGVLPDGFVTEFIISRGQEGTNARTWYTDSWFVETAFPGFNDGTMQAKFYSIPAIVRNDGENTNVYRFQSEQPGDFGVPNILIEQTLLNPYAPNIGIDLRDEVIEKNICVEMEGMAIGILLPDELMQINEIIDYSESPEEDNPNATFITETHKGIQRYYNGGDVTYDGPTGLHNATNTKFYAGRADSTSAGIGGSYEGDWNLPDGVVPGQAIDNYVTVLDDNGNPISNVHLLGDIRTVHPHRNFENQFLIGHTLYDPNSSQVLLTYIGADGTSGAGISYDYSNYLTADAQDRFCGVGCDIQIGEEIIRVIDIIRADSHYLQYNVERGAYGTTPVGHIAGEKVQYFSQGYIPPPTTAEQQAIIDEQIAAQKEYIDSQLESGLYDATYNPMSAYGYDVNCQTDFSTESLSFPNLSEIRAICADNSSVLVAKDSSGWPDYYLVESSNNSNEYIHSSGQEACLQKMKINSDLYFSADNDKRQSLGLFAPKELNSSEDNFTEQISNQLFKQIPKKNLLSNGNGRLVEEVNYEIGTGNVPAYDNFGNQMFGPDGQALFWYKSDASFKPAGGWTYVSLDGVGVHLTTEALSPNDFNYVNSFEHRLNDTDYIEATPEIFTEQYGYAGYLPYLYSFDGEADSGDFFEEGIPLNFDYQWAIWTPSTECFSFGRCLKFKADNNYPYTHFGETGESFPGNGIMELGKYNQYRTLNQTQLIYNDGDVDLNPYQSLKVSFKMKTTDAKNNDLNNTMVEASIMGDYDPNQITTITTTGVATPYSNPFIISSQSGLNSNGNNYASLNWVRSNGVNGMGYSGGNTSSHKFDVPSVRDIMTNAGYDESEIEGKRLIGLTIKRIYWRGDLTWDGSEGADGSFYLGNFSPINSSTLTPPYPNNGRFPATGRLGEDGSDPDSGMINGRESMLRNFLDPDYDDYLTVDSNAGNLTDETYDFYGFAYWNFGSSPHDSGEGSSINNFYADCEFVIAEEGEASDIPEFFYNTSFLQTNGSYNSLSTTFANGVNIKYGAMNRFRNSIFNEWEEFQYTFNLNETHTKQDGLNVEKLAFIIQSSSDIGGYGFNGEVFIDDMKVEESHQFTPDCDVRKKKGPNDYSTFSLTKYYDEEVDRIAYEQTSAPLEAQFYFYPRYFHNEVFNISKDIIFNDFKEGLFYIYDVDWGDGTSKEFTSEPIQIGEDVALYHTYESSGIFEVTGTMIRMKPDKDYNPIGIIHNQKFKLFININEKLDEDFLYFGTEGFSFVPYKNTLPIIGGINEQSIYYKTIKRQLGVVTDDIFADIEFDSIGDRLKTEKALNKMDLSFNAELNVLREYTKPRYSDSSIQDLSEQEGVNPYDVNIVDESYQWEVTTALPYLTDEMISENPDLVNMYTGNAICQNVGAVCGNYDQCGEFNPTDFEYYDTTIQGYVPFEPFGTNYGTLDVPVWYTDINLPPGFWAPIENPSPGFESFTEIDCSTPPHDAFLTGVYSSFSAGGVENNRIAMAACCYIPEQSADSYKLTNGIKNYSEELGKTIGDVDLTNIRFFNKSKSMAEMLGFGLNQEIEINIQSSVDQSYESKNLIWNFPDYDLNNGIPIEIETIFAPQSSLAAVNINGTLYGSLNTLINGKSYVFKSQNPFIWKPYENSYLSNTWGGNPNSVQYWKKIIDKDTSIFERDGVVQNLNQIYIIENSNSQQHWSNQEFTYPVLPKYGPDGKFVDITTNDNGDIIGYPNNRTPFPINGPITDKNYFDENLLISLTTENIESNVFDDKSGNNNYGFAFSDYKPKFNSRTLKPSKNKRTDILRVDKTKGAF